MKKIIIAFFAIAFIQSCGLVTDSGKVTQGDDPVVDPKPSIEAFENYCKTKASSVFVKDFQVPNNPRCRYIAQAYTLPNRDFTPGEMINVGNYSHIGIQTYLKNGDVSVFIDNKFYKRNAIDPVAIAGGRIDLQINTTKVEEYRLFVYVCENLDKAPIDCSGLL
ncbi:MAG: hypothetical protein M9962_07210 [Oligoflexia bacterium]|nr:hypothetical protein [Oligoflexia bacterium]